MSSHAARPSWLPNRVCDSRARAFLQEEDRLACSDSGVPPQLFVARPAGPTPNRRRRMHSSADSARTPNSTWIWYCPNMEECSESSLRYAIQEAAPCSARLQASIRLNLQCPPEAERCKDQNHVVTQTLKPRPPENQDGDNPKNPRWRTARPVNYRRASSVRLVLRDPEFEAGELEAPAAALFLWQEFAHQRFSYCGSSHIFVHCLPASGLQWQ